MEFVNLDPTVVGYVYTWFSLDTCSAVLGQITLDIMAHPPEAGDPSYPTFSEVRSWSTWQHICLLNTIFSCN